MKVTETPASALLVATSSCYPLASNDGTWDPTTATHSNRLAFDISRGNSEVNYIQTCNGDVVT